MLCLTNSSPQEQREKRRRQLLGAEPSREVFSRVRIALWRKLGRLADESSSAADGVLGRERRRCAV